MNVEIKRFIESMIIIIRNQCHHVDFIESKISKFFFLLEFKKLTDLQLIPISPFQDIICSKCHDNLYLLIIGMIIQ